MIYRLLLLMVCCSGAVWAAEPVAENQATPQAVTALQPAECSALGLAPEAFETFQAARKENPTQKDWRRHPYVDSTVQFPGITLEPGTSIDMRYEAGLIWPKRNKLRQNVSGHAVLNSENTGVVITHERVYQVEWFKVAQSSCTKAVRVAAPPPLPTAQPEAEPMPATVPIRIPPGMPDAPILQEGEEPPTEPGFEAIP